MVVRCCMEGLVGANSLLAQTAERETVQLEPADWVRLLATFAGLIILGTTLMVLAWLGARATRRYMHSGQAESGAGRPLDRDDWSKKPLDSD